ncbi:spore coat protein [Peribacillus sp. NPDC056705]|uniref:spore coat protein n=1 Tax=Peribacillus sp. NPDC056705 TaxID=3345918 RepID=UPI00374826ED
MKFKKAYPKIKDPILKTIYRQTIDSLTQNIMDLLKFYPLTPKTGRDDASAAAARELLIFAKSSIKNYAGTITETATPSLRKVFRKHLNGAIDTHAKIFHYLYERNLYPAYDLYQLLQNDVDVSNQTLSQPF